MTDFAVSFPFAYSADLRYKRKRSFVREELVDRIEVAVPRAASADVPAVLVVPHDRIGKQLAYRHDGSHFWKPWSWGPDEASFAEGISARTKRGRVAKLEEWPLPQFSEGIQKSQYGYDAYSILSTDRSIEALDVSEVRDSDRDAKRALAEAAARERFLSIDGTVHVRCHEPVLAIRERYFYLKAEAGVDAWRGTGAFRMPALPEARAGADVEVRGGLEILDPKPFSFEPLAGNVDVVAAFSAALIRRLDDLDDSDPEARLRLSRQVVETFVRSRDVRDGRSGDVDGIYGSLAHLVSMDGVPLRDGAEDREGDGPSFRDGLAAMRTFVRVLGETGRLAPTGAAEDDLDEILLGMGA